MEYSRRPTKSIPKENQLKILNKIYQTYLVSTTVMISSESQFWHFRLYVSSVWSVHNHGQRSFSFSHHNHIFFQHLTHWDRDKMATIFQTTFSRAIFNENIRISINIALNFVAKGPIKNIPVLSETMMVRLPMYMRHSALLSYYCTSFGFVPVSIDTHWGIKSDFIHICVWNLSKIQSCIEDWYIIYLTLVQ